MRSRGVDISERPQTNSRATLELAYKNVAHERDRLRDARAFFARQLGPLPAFGGISAGLVAAFADDFERRWCLFVALGLLVVLVVVSILYSRIAPYRELRARSERCWRARLTAVEPEASAGDPTGLGPEDRLPEDQWYAFQISVERDVYGDPPEDLSALTRLWRLRPQRDAATLQEAVDRERAGVFLAQAVFVLAIGFLVAARV